VFIPNTFSPNGDGLNDIFLIMADEKQVESVSEFHIFDRWGNCLFANEKFMVNDPAQGWDGTFNNREMNNGVFVYYAVLKLVDGTTRMYKGDITIIK